MANNKAPGKDNINERNDTSIKLGTGILLPIPTPKKTQGPVKNLRPITLLEVSRKILSKIFMDRTEEKINKHLSQSQSTYTKYRSTTDAVWTHRWMSTKTQIQDIIIFITGIDMFSALDTIYRDELIKIAEEILDEDELRILSTLQAETTLDVRIENAQSDIF